MQFFRWLYGSLLSLFPRTYREEYGEELLAVFNLSLDDAMSRGAIAVLNVLLRELAGLPMAILYEHLREWRNIKMTDGFGSYFNFASGSWKEFLTALLPFFLACVLMPLMSYLIRLRLIPTSGIVGTGPVFALFGLFIILFIVGLTIGLPRWSLPYFGFVLSLLSVYIFSGLLGFPIFIFFPQLFDQWGLLGDIILQGFLWFGLLIALGLLIVGSRVSPAFEHFRNDWTLLCFVLYGAVPFALWLTFDEYVGDEPYTFLSFLVLAAGAWIYLRNNSEWKRFGVLLGALTLAMFIAAAGKAILVPTQDWPITIDSALAISEAKHTIITWLWLAVSMLVPLAIQLMPRSNGHTRVLHIDGQES